MHTDFYGGRQLPFKSHISHPTISNPNISNFKISDLNISNLKISNLNISNLVALTAGCFSIRKLDSLAPPPAPDVSTRKERGRSLGRDLFPDPMHHACEKRVWGHGHGDIAIGTVPILDSTSICIDLQFNAPKPFQIPF